MTKLYGVYLASWLALVAWIVWPPQRDDSDWPDGPRSGMIVLTDHLTGCQYLVRSGITPRMDGDGKQVCTKGTP